jgi:hypothetical protein
MEEAGTSGSWPLDAGMTGPGLGESESRTGKTSDDSECSGGGGGGGGAGLDVPLL